MSSSENTNTVAVKYTLLTSILLNILYIRYIDRGFRTGLKIHQDMSITTQSYPLYCVHHLCSCIFKVNNNFLQQLYLFTAIVIFILMHHSCANILSIHMYSASKYYKDLFTVDQI